MTRSTALKFLLSALTIVIPSMAFSQANYKIGFIVPATGDTSGGLIDLKEWEKTPQSIHFKKDENSKPEKLGLEELQAFGISGNGFFEKHTVNISLGAIRMAGLSEEKDTTSETRTVFLEVIEKGRNVSLYSYTDKIKTRFYIQKPGIDTGPEELQYYPYLENRKVRGAEIFASKLHLLALANGVSSSKLIGRLQSIQYTKKDILNVVREINGPQENTTREEKTSASRFFAGAFLSTSPLIYKGDDPLAKDGATHTSAFLPGISLGYDSFVNKHVQKVVLRLAGAVSLQRASTNETSYYINTFDYRTTSHDLEYLHISFNPQIIYNVFNQAQFKTFLAAGFTLSRNVYLENEYRGAYGSKKNDEDLGMRKAFLSYSAAAGVQVKKKIECYIKYSPSLELVSSTRYSTSIRQISVGMNYLFK